MRLSSFARLALPCLAVAPAFAAPLQLTTGNTNSLGPRVSADGSRVAFYSASDLTGGNADKSFEIFVYERGSGQLRQISEHTGGAFTGGNQTPSISGDGSRLVFQNFASSGGYSYFKTQSYDLNANALTTLTAPGFFESSAISRDGKTIAVSTGNLGLRLYDVDSQSFSGVLLPAPSAFSMSGDARFFAYESFSQGVRLFDRSTGTTVQVSGNGSGFNQRPVLSADGSSLAFVAAFDPLGLNADLNTELFRYDLASQTLKQITVTTGATASAPSLSGDGRRIAFSSTGNLTGGNADGSLEVFVYDLLSGQFDQLTDTQAGLFSSEASLSEDGRTLAYVSNARGGMQIFLDTLAPLPDAGRLPEPASIALVLAALALLPAARGRGRHTG